MAKCTGLWRTEEQAKGEGKSTVILNPQKVIERAFQSGLHLFTYVSLQCQPSRCEFHEGSLWVVLPTALLPTSGPDEMPILWKNTVDLWVIRGLEVLTFCTVGNPCITKVISLYSRIPSHWVDPWTTWIWTVRVNWKTLHISEFEQFKPMWFEGQLYFMSEWMHECMHAT